jgi:hypothetical protein
MNDMVSSRKTGGLAWSGTLQSLSGPEIENQAAAINQ